MHEARKKVDNLKAELRVARNNLKTYKVKLAEEQKKMEEIEAVQSLFQSAIALLYTNLSSKLSAIITEGINIVFPDAKLRMVIHFEERRNNVEADILLVDEDDEEFTVLYDSGGGLGDFIALLLKITYITLSKYDNILIADEPLKFVDRERIPEAAAFIRKVCEDFKFQLIMVSHIPSLADSSDIVYKVVKSKGVSKIIKIKG